MYELDKFINCFPAFAAPDSWPRRYAAKVLGTSERTRFEKDRGGHL